MGIRRIVGVVSFFIIAGVVLAVVLVGPSSLLGQAQDRAQPPLQVTTLPASNAIVRENSYPGTTSWKIPDGKASTIEIQGYTNAPSVAPGHNLIFYVSTQEEGINYSISIYRLGWYGGLGGRLLAFQGGLMGHQQGYYDLINHKLVNCRSCRIDPGTGLVEANWQPSYSLTVPPDWVTGVYLAKFTDVRGRESYAPFDVRGNSDSQYIIVTPDTTYEAYNPWGGYSLYAADKIVHTTESASLPRGVKVSFDRPYTDQEGSSQVLIYEADAIHWMERQGYDLSYTSDIDLHENPAQLLIHRGYISFGHDEYWTKEMRDGVEHARDSGVGLVFLGANASYWQIRLQSDSAGIPDRTIICYKVETQLNDLAHDPLYGIDNSRVTTQWRDPLLNRPENALIGVMFSSLTYQQPGFPWQVNPGAHSRLLDGTGLQAGKPYGCDFVGNEWDRVITNGATPAGLQIIGTSQALSTDDKIDVSNTTYYIAASGALVFASGSIQWASALDNYRFSLPASCPQKQQSLIVPGMQKLLANVMDALVKNHPLL